MKQKQSFLKVEDSLKIVQLFCERTYSVMLHLRLN